MKGDKLVIHKGHKKAAFQVFNLLLDKIKKKRDKFVITIAGESGSGKSEIAYELSELLAGKGFRNIILQQDDYFVYPPKTNTARRREDINRVGIGEVHLDLLDRNLKDIKAGKSEVQKPLVLFEEDLISEETIELKNVKALIAEGTYTTCLKNVDRHIFIDRTNIDTKEARKKRAREEQDEFLEEILKIEHRIISSHKKNADIIITRDYEAINQERD